MTMSMQTIRKNIFTLLSAGVLSAFASAPAFAVTGEPLAFDGFTASSGQISADCGQQSVVMNPDGSGTGAWTNPNGDVLNVSCSAPTISDGMLQREVTVDSTDSAYNGTYVQFILTDSGASGDAAAAAFSTERGSLYFTNEDFIKMNNRGEGIATKQVILESTFDNATFIEDRLAMETVYKIGWAKGVGFTDPWLTMNQDLAQLQYDNTQALATSAFDLFTESMALESNGPVNDNTKFVTDQMVYMQDDKNAVDDAVQKFKHARTSGAYTSLPTDFFGGLINPNPILPGGTNGGVVDWNAGNSVSATWVGVKNVDPVNATIDRLFGFTEFKNETTTTGNTSSKLVSFSDNEAGGGLIASGPLAGQPIWNSIRDVDNNPMFGAAELMSYVAPVTMTDFAVMDPAILLGPLNLDYIANTDPALITTPGGLTVVESDYNQWTINNGVFTASCPSFAEACATVAINEGGFYQRWIKVAGEDYLQTIIVDDGGKAGVLDPTAANFATNSIAFINETFIKKGSGGTGIASNMHMAERANSAYMGSGATVDLPSTSGDFTTDVAMNTGWANQGSIFVARDMNGDNIIDPGEGITEPHAVIDIEQSVLVPDGLATSLVSMQEDFSLQRGVNESDKRIVMSSTIGTRAGVGFIEPIVFNSVTVSGAYQRTARTDFAVSDPFLLPSDPTQDLAWDAGDALQATWLGADYGTYPGLESSKISSTSFTNLTSGARIAYTDILNVPVGPDNWFVDPFLPAPTYP